jgi:formylglycine-generating enzyme required for sulfatase activity
MNMGKIVSLGLPLLLAAVFLTTCTNPFFEALLGLKEKGGTTTTGVTFTTPAEYREMVSLSGGTIEGGNAYKNDDGYAGVFIAGRTVTLSPFRIAKYETTYELWYEVRQWAISNGYTIANAGREGHNGTDGAAPTADAKTEPVTCISWRDTVIWCNAYSEMSGKEPVYYTDSIPAEVLKISTNVSGTNTVADKAVMKDGANGYRLPTEAEWEYAARGGTPSLTSPFTDKWAGTDDPDELEEYAWYLDNSSSDTHPVGGKKKNDAALYDMSGNVWEWCWDWWGTIFTGPETDPKGPPASGSYRVFRGGSWFNAASSCAVALRIYNDPDGRGPGLGFRVVCP